jgi:hypothetical protein
VELRLVVELQRRRDGKRERRLVHERRAEACLPLDLRLLS